MTWLNWSLKLHSGLRTIPHLILTHNTQEFNSINAYLICVIVHVQMWCLCSSTCWSNLKRFLSVLCVFESDFILLCFFFLFNIHFCVFLQKTGSESFHEKLATESFPRNVLKGNFKVTFSYRKSRYCLMSISRLNSSREMFLGKTRNFSSLYKGYRDCFATKSFSRKLQYVSRLISWLSNPRKMRVFSFYVADVTSFQKLLTSLALPLSNLSQPKTIFHSNPINSKLVFYNFNFKVCFLKHFSSYLS